LLYRITRIRVWPVIRVVFIVNGVIGFLTGLIYTVFFSVLGSIISRFAGDAVFPNLGLLTGFFGFLISLFLGMIYGVFGAGLAAVTIWLYNMLSDAIGGIEFEMEPVSLPTASPEPAAPAYDSPAEAPDDRPPESARTPAQPQSPPDA
jgi:hypothetical protein